MDIKALGLSKEDLQEAGLDLEDFEFREVEGEDDVQRDDEEIFNGAEDLVSIRRLSSALTAGEPDDPLLLKQLDSFSALPKLETEDVFSIARSEKEKVVDNSIPSIAMIKAKAKEAVQLKHDGDRIGALCAMREYKKLMSQNKVQGQTAHIAKASGVDPVVLVARRYKEYAECAIALRKLGRIEQTRSIVLDIRKIKYIREQVEFGGSIVGLPPPVNEVKEYSLEEIESTYKKVPSSLSGWDQLFILLDSHITQCTDAVEHSRLYAERNRCLLAQERGCSPPHYQIHTKTITENVGFPKIPLGIIQLSIEEWKGLLPPSGFDSFYFEVQFGYGTDNADCIRSPVFTSLVSCQPWTCNLTLKAQRIGRGFKFAKISISAKCPQRFFASKLLGSADFRIGGLLECAEVSCEVPLRRESRPKGKLSVIAQVHKPLSGKPCTNVVKRERIIIGNDTPTPEKIPVDSQITANLQVVDGSDPHSLTLFVSNDVLQAEINQLGHAIAVKKAKGEVVSKSLQSRYDKSTLNIMVLQDSVSEGKLSLEEYLQSLRDSIQVHTQLTLFLKKSGNIPDAKLVLKRLKIMKLELSGAENGI